MAITTTRPFAAYDGACLDLVKITLENRWKVYSATDILHSVPENLYKLCDDATWLMIIDRKHPGEGYRNQLIDTLTRISKHFGGLGNRLQAAHVARLLGSWDVERGCCKTWSSIVPIRSLMDM